LAIFDLDPLLLNQERLQIAAIAKDGVNAIYARAINGLA
jgi:phosphoserine phosphatase